MTSQCPNSALIYYFLCLTPKGIECTSCSPYSLQVDPKDETLHKKIVCDWHDLQCLMAMKKKLFVFDAAKEMKLCLRSA